MYKALAERRIAGMEREQNSLMDQIDKIYGVRSGARYPPRPTPVVISGGITLNKVHVEQGAIAGVANAGSNSVLSCRDHFNRAARSRACAGHRAPDRDRRPWRHWVRRPPPTRKDAETRDLL